MSDFKPDSDPMELNTSDEEIEIIEIVGLEEDSPAARPVRDEATVSPQEAAEEEQTEFVVDLDEEPERIEENGREVPPVSEVPFVSDREQLTRLQADYENFKKRVDREREANERHAAAQLVSRLLPVLDNFERALSAARQVDGQGTFTDGIGLIFRQLLEELRKEGLTAVDTVGEPFDPEIHEAVATIEGSGLPANTVVEEMQRGYLLHGRLLRPALVKVSVDSSSSVDGAGVSEDG